MVDININVAASISVLTPVVLISKTKKAVIVVEKKLLCICLAVGPTPGHVDNFVLL